MATASVNATVRIRAISPASLDAILAIIEDEARGFVVLEMFDSTERPPVPA